jgi:hypothetical protein
MAEAVHKTGSAVLIDKHAQKTAFRLGVTPDAVRQEFKKSMARAPAPDEQAETETSVWQNPTESFRQELWLLELLLAHEELVPWVAECLKPEWLVNEPIRNVAFRCIELHDKHNWKGVSAFLAEFEDSLSAELITEALVNKRETEDPEAVIKGTKSSAGFLVILRDQWIDRELRAIRTRLADPALTELEQQNLVRQQMDLRQLKSRPIQPLDSSLLPGSIKP